MNRIRLLVVGTLMMVAVNMAAQQPASSGAPANNGQHAVVPTAEDQLTFLTGKLDLTGKQQRKMKPILQVLHDRTVKLTRDESLSSEERMSKIRLSREEADKKIRPILNEEQKKKLDQVEHEPHPELHGKVAGAI